MAQTGTGTGPRVDPASMEHPNNLRILRIAAGVQKQPLFAKSLGVPRYTYAMMERGHRPIPKDVLARAAKRLGISPDAITDPSLAAAASEQVRTAGPAARTKRAAAVRRRHRVKANGHDPVAGFAPAGTPTMVLLFAAAANLPPERWPMAIRILQAMALED